MTEAPNPSSLRRYPKRENDPLQAWDAADELLLEHTLATSLPGERTLILNDHFGALSFGLAALKPVTYTDSFVSAKAILQNTNGQVIALHELTQLEGTFDRVLIQIPKNLAFFEDLLAHATQHLKPGAQVACGYMIKHQTKSSFELLHKYMGKTQTSLAKKKARLIFTEYSGKPATSPYPTSHAIEGFEKPFTHAANLFSREKLDQGTRFLLDHLPEPTGQSVLDLGCGNGILGIAAKLKCPDARILFADDSFQAIQSAKLNYETQVGEGTPGFFWTNCFEEQAAASVDFVLCNPPFHQGNTLADHIAWQMFKDARHALKPGGWLRVVGNSHLRHSNALKKIFGNSREVARNQKFTIQDAER